MPHGLTIDELCFTMEQLAAARKRVVNNYRAVNEAAAECIEARAFDIPPANHGDEVTDEHFERIKELVDQDQFKDAEVVSGPAW